MWKALLWKDLRAHALALLGLWGVILAAAGLSLYEPWREGAVIGFAVLAPIVVAGLLTVTLGTSEAAQGTALFLDGLPASRRRVWGVKALLVGWHLAAAALISLGLIAFLVRSYPLLDDRPQAAREAAVGGPIFLGLSLQAAVFVALLGFACAVASTSMKQAALRLLFWGGALVTAVVLVQVRLGQAIFLETASQPVLDWLFRAVLFAVALVAAGTAWRQATRGGPLDAPLRRRRIGRAAFLGTVAVALLAAPIYLLSPRGTARDIVRVDHARFSFDGRQLLLQTVTRRWGREFLGRLWCVDSETGAAQPFGPGHLPVWYCFLDNTVQYHRWKGDPVAQMLYDPATRRTRRLPLPKRIRRELRSGVRYQQFSPRHDTGEVFYQYHQSREGGNLFLSPACPTPRLLSTPDGQPLSYLAWDYEPSHGERSEVLMNAGGSGLWWMELPSRRMWAVVRSDHFLEVDPCLLSPDRQWLYYWILHQEKEGDESRGLHVVRRDGTEGRLVHEKGKWYHTPPRWSPNSRYLAVFLGKPGTAFRKLIIHDLSSGATQRFTLDLNDPQFPRETWQGSEYPPWKHLQPGCNTDLIHPAWSPDSECLAFAVSQSGMVRREEIAQGYQWCHQTISLWVFDRTSGHLRCAATLSDVEYDLWEPIGMSRPWIGSPIIALAWDARGRILVVTQTGDFFAVDPETGKRTEVIPDP